MGALKATFLLVLFSFVLAHATVPHHHHVEPPQKKHHQHQNKDHHHHHHDEPDKHSAFSFSQIDDIFLFGKQLSVPILIAFIPTSSFSLVITEEDVTLEYFDQDILRPPLINIPQHSFRGPPTLS